jgi:putative Ca2+/H+ antiporter (TMEM165/GDT1 family)
VWGHGALGTRIQCASDETFDTVFRTGSGGSMVSSVQRMPGPRKPHGSIFRFYPGGRGRRDRRQDALLLAARFKRPVPIVLGILAATVFNHALAGLLGGWIRTALDPELLRWGVGLSFLAIAAWALVPDKLDEKTSDPLGKYGVFAVTLVAFFFAEIGDKTQLATVALAARFDQLVAVVAGTTAGMLIADVPAVMLGDRTSVRLPMKLIRCVSAALFAAMGIAALMGFGIT